MSLRSDIFELVAAYTDALGTAWARNEELTSAHLDRALDVGDRLVEKLDAIEAERATPPHNDHTPECAL